MNVYDAAFALFDGETVIIDLPEGFSEVTDIYINADDGTARVWVETNNVGLEVIILNLNRPQDRFDVVPA